MLWDLALGANKVIGLIVMMVCAYKWSAYLATLHENHFWFSEIKVFIQLKKNIKKSSLCNGQVYVTGSRTRNFLPDGKRPGTDLSIDFVGFRFRLVEFRSEPGNDELDEIFGDFEMKVDW